MKLITFSILILCSSYILPDIALPDYLIGDFTDDYDIQYTITDTTWIQWPHFEMNIVEIDTAEMYILGYDTGDSTFTRVDYMPFENQGDFKWGFCYSSYEEKNKAEAMIGVSANRQAHKTGCNGFPFSRMKALK